MGILVLVLVIGALLAVTYNSLVSSRNKVKNSWSQIEVQLKRRFDLVPNLIETVKGYMEHEKDTFVKIADLRSRFQKADTPQEQMETNNMMSKALAGLYAVAENYPDLKANENFISLQDELSRTEDKISFTRQFYNDSVMMYNNKIEQFPSNIVANIFGFRQETFFEAAEEEKQAPKVKF